MLEMLSQFAAANPFVAGLGGATAAGAAIAHIKSVPTAIAKGIKGQFTTTITIYSEDRIFEQIDRWLSAHPSTRKMRKLNIAEWRERRARHDHYDFGVSPGEGWHSFWHEGRLFFVQRKIDTEKGPSGGYDTKRRQTLTLTTLGRDQAPILEWLQAVKNVKTASNTIPIYIWNGCDPTLVDEKPKRSMDTVYLNNGIKERLIADILTFQESADLYRQRGTPYRRGYMLKGPPGTGKTTLIFALASLFGKPVYLIPASSVGNDKELLAAFNAAEDHIIVLEDIDSVRASEDRATAKKPEVVGDVREAGITLSGLLNAMDGLGARDGRLLFVTTNAPEALDPALLRPGRIDVSEHLDRAGPMEAKAMYERFFPDQDPAVFMAEIEKHLPMAQADLQNRLLSIS